MKKLFTIAIVIITFGIVGYGMIPGKVSLMEDTLTFSGRYGIKLKLSEIASVSLIDRLPPIKSRTNGLSALGVKKGFFNLEGYGKSRLLVNSSQPPFLLIMTNNQETIILNLKDPKDTKSAFEQIKEGI